MRVSVPQTVVIATDGFDRFLDAGGLRDFAIRCADDGEIERRFLDAEMPPELLADLRAFVERVGFPLAVRSSSLLEDSQHQPFAGMYRTYMLPHNDPDPQVRNRPEEMRQLNSAELELISRKRPTVRPATGPLPLYLLLASPSVWGLCLMYGFVGFAGNFITSFLNVYLRDHRRLPDEATS